MHARSAAIYKKVYVESATPVRVLDELYGRLISDMTDAETHVLAGNVKAKANAIDHALKVVAELTAALDHEVAPELSGNLARLYDYVSTELIQAGAKMDGASLARIKGLISGLKDAFQEASAS